jgi:peptidoglycan/xylan/chitin deacetylase (PgdA/CDA1 family)
MPETFAAAEVPGRSRRERLARVAKWTGLATVVEHWPRRPGILVINHHRVLRPDGCEYDHGVIDCTPEQFARQVRWLRDRFPIFTLDEVLEAVEKPRQLRRCGVLLTFDDGYLDNYQVAFPILQSLGVQGTFFLPTSYIGTSRLPWWDRIARVLRETRHASIRLGYPEKAVVELSGDREAAIRQVLTIYKSPAMRDPGRFFDELFAACGCECPAESESPLFMTWRQAAEMARAGMAFGSHTHTHELLAKLTPEAQYEELTVSRDRIESELAVRVEAVAYPVGSRTAFSAATREAVRRAGYRAGFSYYGGINRAETVDASDILRTTVERTVSFELFRMRTALLATAMPGAGRLGAKLF